MTVVRAVDEARLRAWLAADPAIVHPFLTAELRRFQVLFQAPDDGGRPILLPCKSLVTPDGLECIRTEVVEALQRLPLQDRTTKGKASNATHQAVTLSSNV